MEEITLTTDQEQKMLVFWNLTPSDPPSLKEITIHIFGQDLDGRTKEGKAIKKALSAHNLRARVTTTYQPVEGVELSEAHKLYIQNNAATMNALEIAKTIFSNNNLTNLHIETRSVNEHIKTLDRDIVLDHGQQTQDVPSGNYEPPKTMDKVLRRVNSYLNETIDKDKVSASQKKSLEQLINYLHTFRFIKQMNTFDSEDDRRSCEDAFVRYTYDKPDLSQEEVDQYIVLANEVVIAFKAQRRSEHLQQMLEDITGSNPDNAHASMSLVESIGKTQTEYHQCINRQQKLLDDLKEKRSSRLSKQIKDNASILNLIQEWKQEEGRKKMLRYVELEQKAVAEEIDKLSSIADLKARIFGLNKQTILNS